jgi:hypothetical protein
MGAGVLAITLSPELVTLITRPADPPTDGPRRTSGPARWAIRVLTVLLLGTGPGKVRVVYTNVLLELL